MVDNESLLNYKNKTRFHNAFICLKTVCDQVAQNPSNDNAKQLKTVLNSLKLDLVLQFKHYIILPVFIHLSNKKVHKSSTICSVLECLQVILERVPVDDINLFWKIYSLIMEQICEGHSQNLSVYSEELKLAVVKCLGTALRNLRGKIMEQIYSRAYYPKFGFAIYICTQLARNEKFISLRMEALKCILYFAQLDKTKATVGPFQEKIADIIMLMLPGIMTCCIAVCSESDIQNHQILVLALQLWGGIISLVMDDSQIGKSNNNLGTGVLKMNDQRKIRLPMPNPITGEDMKMIIDAQKRDKDWLEISGYKLGIVTDIIVKLQQHDNCKVRKQLAVECNNVLQFASKSLSSSVGSLIGTLIVLSQDEHKEIAEISKKGLSKFATKCDVANEKKLVEIVEECFFIMLTRLPRILNGVDITLKEKQLLLFGGYIDVLGHTRTSIILNSVQHLHRLLKCLYMSATVDFSNITLLEEISIRDVDEFSTYNDNSWKKLKHCCTPRSQACLEHICQKLVKNPAIRSLIESMLDDFNSDYINRKEIILLFQYMFSTESSNCCDVHEELVKQILYNLIEPNVWDLPVAVGPNGVNSRAEAQSNVVQICLLTETVGSLAVSLGNVGFQPFLLRCLYPLLECAGSPIYAISMAGLKSVNHIGKLYGGGVSELVANNVDYLSHHVTLNLRHAHRNPRVLSVLSVIMKHSSLNVLPSLYEIVNDVLVQSCDVFQDMNGNAYLHVFHTFVTCLKDWLRLDIFIDSHVENKKSIIEEFEEFYANKIITENYLNDVPNDQRDMSDDCENSDGIKEEKSDIPDYVKFTIQILNRTMHFLPKQDISRQITVLQILEKGIVILSKWENELLPIVHKIWSPLVDRFCLKNNPLLIRRAFILLLALARTAKDFIRARTLKEVIPSLCHILKSSAGNSRKEKSTGAYVLSQNYKLQLALLNGIGDLYIDMDVTGKDIDLLLDATTAYLSKFQPKTLQEACRKLYLKLAEKDVSCVWLHLVSLSPTQKVYDAPVEGLKTLMLKGDYQYEEFNFNSVELLSKISKFW